MIILGFVLLYLTCGYALAWGVYKIDGEFPGELDGELAVVIFWPFWLVLIILYVFVESIRCGTRNLIEFARRTRSG